MLFNSYIFIFAFLPVALLGYAILIKLQRKSLALGWLTACSWFFYGWWKPVYLPLLWSSILINYGLSWFLFQRTAASPKQRKAVLIVGLVFNISLLGYFKYANFFVSNLQAIGVHWTLDNIILPLGISFFTFQKIAYLVDVYRGKVTNVNFLDYSFFVSFFPQLIAGPIVHHSEIIPQVRRDRIRQLEAKNFSLGLMFFVSGLFSKSVIADGIAPVANALFGAASRGVRLDMLEAWVGAIAYSLQLYFDFAGYSYMAIGLGLLFNIKLPANFNSPYQATSIIDFWRRWHITLSAFLRDYLYIPLGGNRCHMPRNLFNLLATMLIGGLWHGANWTFVLWGGMHGVMLGVNHIWRTVRGKRDEAKGLARPLGTIIGMGSTFLFVVLGWVLFRADSFQTAGRYFASLFGFNRISVPVEWRTDYSWIPHEFLRYRGFLPHLPISSWALIWLGALLLWALLAPNLLRIMYRYRDDVGTEGLVKSPAPAWMTFNFTLRWAVLVGALMTVGICALSKTSEFLYFQF